MLIGSTVAFLVLVAVVLIRQRKEYVYFILSVFPATGVFVPLAISTGAPYGGNLKAASKIYVEISHLQEACHDRIRDDIYDKTCIGYRAVLVDRYKEAVDQLIVSADTANTALEVALWPFGVD